MVDSARPRRDCSCRTSSSLSPFHVLSSSFSPTPLITLLPLLFFRSSFSLFFLSPRHRPFFSSSPSHHFSPPPHSLFICFSSTQCAPGAPCHVYLTLSSNSSTSMMVHFQSATKLAGTAPAPQIELHLLLNLYFYTLFEGCRVFDNGILEAEVRFDTVTHTKTADFKVTVAASEIVLDNPYVERWVRPLSLFSSLPPFLPSFPPCLLLLPHPFPFLFCFSYLPLSLPRLDLLSSSDGVGAEYHLSFRCRF